MDSVVSKILYIAHVVGLACDSNHLADGVLNKSTNAWSPCHNKVRFFLSN